MSLCREATHTAIGGNEMLFADSEISKLALWESHRTFRRRTARELVCRRENHTRATQMPVITSIRMGGTLSIADGAIGAALFIPNVCLRYSASIRLPT